MTAEELESYTTACWWAVTEFPAANCIMYSDQFVAKLGLDKTSIPILTDQEFVENLRRANIALWLGDDGMFRFVRQNKRQLYSPYYLSRNKCAYCNMQDPGPLQIDPENAEKRVHTQCQAPLAKLRLRIKMRRLNGLPAEV